jgi:hypothetical protein
MFIGIYRQKNAIAQYQKYQAIAWFRSRLILGVLLSVLLPLFSDSIVSAYYSRKPPTLSMLPFWPGLLFAISGRC